MKSPYDFGLLLRRIRKDESNTATPPMETLRSLAVILNISLDELCGTQSRGTASLYGLSETQAKIVHNLIIEFREHNKVRKKRYYT